MGDIKANRVVVLPFKVSDLPYTDSDFRMYKMQFQGSTKRRVVHVEGVVVGDTYVGEDTYRDITVRISLTFLRLD